MNNERWRIAYDTFLLRVREEPENGELWYDFATFLDEECDNPNLVVKAYENAQKFLDEDLRLQLGDAYAKAGAFDRGIALITQYIAEKPSAHAYVFLSEALRRADRLDEAKRALEEAMRIEPAFEEPYFLMGDLLRKVSLETAIHHYRRAIALDQEYQLAWRQLGAALLHDERTIEEGIEALCRATALDPEDGWSHAYLAIGYWKAGQPENADAEYRRAIEAFPDFPLFQQYYADFLADRARAAHAIHIPSAYPRD